MDKNRKTFRHSSLKELLKDSYSIIRRCAESIELQADFKKQKDVNSNLFIDTSKKQKICYNFLWHTKNIKPPSLVF